MKKSKVLLLFSFVICFCGIIAAFTLDKQPKAMKEINDEKILRKYIDILSCVPEQQIDKEVIFAEAMKQYWQYKMDKLWDEDKNLNNIHNFPYRVKIVEDHCGLKFNWRGKPSKMTKETCYPWVVSYKDLDELFQALLSHKFEFHGNHREYVESAFRQRMYSLNAKPYNPKTDANIYLGEQNFSIIKRDGATYTDFYPADCCSLLSYQEIAEKDENYKGGDYFLHFIFPSLPREVLTQIYFLKIRAYTIDDVQYDAAYEGLGANLRSDYNEEGEKNRFFESEEKYSYSYHPVSLCGKGIFSRFLLQ